MEPIGDYLKRERELRSISLEEISKTTRIRPAILHAVEKNQLDSLGSPVFVKGFLRAYAQYVGLNPNDVVLRYEAFLKGEDQESKAEERSTDRQSQWKYRYIMLPISILVVLGVLIFLLIHRPSNPPINTVPQQKEEPTPKSAEPTEPLPSTATTDAEVLAGDEIISDPPENTHIVNPPPVHPKRPLFPSPPETTSAIEIELRALEETWMRLSIDKGSPQEILLRPGEVISRRGVDIIEMKVGNAGGVELLYNGKDVGTLGESGQVVHLSIGPQEAQIRGKSGTSTVTSMTEETR
jgi:cytoskeletal protein RodZ